MKKLLLYTNYISLLSAYLAKSKFPLYFIAILFLVLAALPTQAQLTKIWETPPFKYSSEAGNRFVKQSVDGAGNLVILGSELTLYKFDATGKQLWATKYGSYASTLSNAGLWVDKSDNIYVLWSDVLLKYDPTGNLLWNKAFSNVPGSISAVANITLDDAGNIYLTGTMNDAGTSVMATQKLSAAGTELWTSKAAGISNGEVIEVDNRGSVFVLTSATDIVLGNESIILIKYDAATGTELMQKFFNTPRIPGYTETAKKLLLTKTGEIYAIVNTSSGSTGVLKVFLHKIAPNGSLIYKNQIGQTDAAVFFDAVFTANEEILFLCREQKYRTTWDHFMTKVDANGQHMWLHKFNVYEANQMVRYFAPAPTGMSLNADGSIAIAGSYSYFRIPPSFSAPEVYTEYPKFILATFTKDGVETWRQVMEHTTTRDGGAAVSFINNKSLFVIGAQSNLPDFYTPVNLVAMKYQDCSGFTANAGADKQICAGGNTQLQATGGTTYAWAPATGLSATNIANPVATPTATTTYTVTVTNAEGCTATDQVVVTVNPMPTASITAGGATTFCEGGSVILSATSGTGYTYQWLRNGGAINQATGNTYTAITAGDYSVIVKAAGECSVTATSVKVTVSEMVTASAGADKEICAGGSVQLEATGGTTYSWSPATGLSAANVANPIASPATTTTYSVTVSNGNGCTATDQVTVKVNAAPSVSITPAGATTFCEGGSVVLNATQGADYDYKWFKDGNLINNATGNSFTTFAAGEFKVRVKRGNCETMSAPVIVTINKPAVVNAGSAQTVCASSAAFTLTGFSPAGGIWSGAGVSPNGVFNPATAGTGTHNLTYTVTQNNCSASATKTITVSPGVATPGAITGNTTTCAGATNLTYSINAVANAENYTWTVPEGFTITEGQGTISIKVTAGSNSGSITVKANNNCGPSAAASIAVNVTAQPTASITVQGNTTFCEGGSVILIAPAGTNYTYQWLLNGNIISGATGADYSATSAGNYTLQVKNGSCTKTSAQVAVNVTEGIRNNTIATGNQTMCTGATATTLQGSTPTGGATNYTYQWEQSTDGTTYTSIQGATAQNFTPANLTTTTWFRRKVVSGSCSNTSAAVKITLQATPTVSLSAFGKMCTDDDALTLAGGQPAGGTYSGTGVTNGIFDAATAGAGTHTITYTYTDASGCSATATQTIEVEAACEVTGVEEDEPPYKFVFFPNPAKDKLNIEVELPDKTDVTIQLADARGRIILQKSYTGQIGAFAETIVLENKARGMYILRFTTKDGTYNRKVLLW